MPERKGPNSSRGDFRLIDLDYTTVPIHGYATAGQHFAGESQLRPVMMAATIERHGRPVYCLEIRGVSMEGAGILPGDLVFVSPKVPVVDGSIVAVMVGTSDPILKRFRAGKLYSEYRNRRVLERFDEETQIIGGMAFHLYDAVNRMTKTPPATERM